MRERTWERDSGICQLCGEPVALDEATLDRIDPSLRYSPENVQITCFECNNRKGDQVLERFAYRESMEEKLAQLKQRFGRS